ncbi:MAG: hypothetical protein ACOYLB_11350, partial [Phototrophicaceae bacterium]
SNEMFVEFNTKNLHISYPEVTRHWSPKSETYAGGDCVLTAIDRGWQFHDVVGHERYWLGGGRYNSVYHFRIKKGMWSSICQSLALLLLNASSHMGIFTWWI